MKTEQQSRKKLVQPGIGKVIRRLLNYVVGRNQVRFIAVIVCIIISAAAGVMGSVFIRRPPARFIPPPMALRFPACVLMSQNMCRVSILASRSPVP